MDLLKRSDKGLYTDKTKAFLKTLEKPFHYISENDNGIYNAMNKGIALSKGKWLYFLGADDILYDKAVLQEIAKELSGNSQLVLGSIQYDITKKTSKFLQRNKEVFRTEWSKKMWIKNTVHHQAVLYRKELFLKNQFDESYQVLADYAFNLNLFRQKVQIKKIAIIIALCGDVGISKKHNWSLYKEEIRLKTAASSRFYWLLFVKIAILKYLFKKV